MSGEPIRVASRSIDTPRRGVVAVIARDERLLVIRRSETVVAPGAYCFPGGGIHDHEDEPQALLRELQEELNVVIVPVQRLWTSVTPWQVHLAWWLAELPTHTEPIANPAEVASIHWLSTAELRELDGVLESNRHFLDALDRGEIASLTPGPR